MGKCKYNHYKKKCKKDICCFECKGKCEFENERCFTQKTYRESILRGYPKICKLYIEI